MTDSFVTQCPHCQTRFRVTGAQLGIAGGSVRCGACLLVFNAARQLDAVEPAPAAPAPAPEPTPEDIGSSPFGDAPFNAPPAAPASLSAQGDYRPPLQVFRPAGGILRPDAPVTPTEAAVSPQPAPQPQPQSQPAEASPEIRIDLEQINAQLAQMSDDQRPQVRVPPRRRRQETPATEPEPAAAAPVAPATAPSVATATPAAAAVAAVSTAAVTTTASSAVDDEPAVTPQVQPETTVTARSEDDELPLEQDDEPPLGDAHAILDDEDDGREPSLHAEPDEEPLISGLSAADDDDPVKPAPAAPLHETLINLNAEPLQLEWPEQRSPWRALVWLLLSLLAAVGLIAQYAWFNFDLLARQPQWRPWFEQICPQIGCELPSRVDTSQIRSSNLTVRSHPNQTGALQVDAIIYNRAEFAQPFPLLEVRFEDMNHLVLAQRNFHPSEYLGGELAGSKDMPPQTPIHIALEIVDPGLQATNYFLDFHSPE